MFEVAGREEMEVIGRGVESGAWVVCKVSVEGMGRVSVGSGIAAYIV